MEKGGTVWFNTSRKIHDLEERLWRLERDNKALQAEWDSAYDKLRTLTGRFVKRAEQIEKHEEMVDRGNGSPTGFTTATSALDPVSKRILERRARIMSPQPKVEESA